MCCHGSCFLSPSVEQTPAVLFSVRWREGNCSRDKLCCMHCVCFSPKEGLQLPGWVVRRFSCAKRMLRTQHTHIIKKGSDSLWHISQSNQLLVKALQYIYFPPWGPTALNFIHKVTATQMFLFGLLVQFHCQSVTFSKVLRLHCYTASF